MRKVPCLLGYTYTKSSSNVGRLLHLQYYQRCEYTILKSGWKLIFFVTTTLLQLTQKNSKKIHAFEVLIFWKRTVIVNPKRFTSSNILRRYTFGRFCNSKFNYFSERPNKVKERFRNIFDWPLCWGYWK